MQSRTPPSKCSAYLQFFPRRSLIRRNQPAAIQRFPLRYSGIDTLRKRAGEWLSSFQGPIGYDVHDLHITAGEDVSFCHSLNHVSGIAKATGKKIDMWWRATLCFRKVDGNWTVTHEHSSVPFDMESGKASLNLKP